MDLSDVINVPLTFKLADKEYRLRYFTLEDIVWLGKEVTHERYNQLFNGSNPNPEDLAKVLYHQLEDKKDFAVEEIEDYDIDGNLFKKQVGGYRKFLRAIDTKSLNTLLILFYELHFESNPKESEEDKKKVKAMKDKYFSEPKKQNGKK